MFCGVAFSKRATISTLVSSANLAAILNFTTRRIWAEILIVKEPIRELRCHYLVTCVYNKCNYSPQCWWKAQYIHLAAFAAQWISWSIHLHFSEQLLTSHLYFKGRLLIFLLLPLPKSHIHVYQKVREPESWPLQNLLNIAVTVPNLGKKLQIKWDCCLKTDVWAAWLKVQWYLTMVNLN